MPATWRGEFDEAERLALEATRLGTAAGDPNARRTLDIRRLSRLRL
jgi:hypothetical protein